MPRPWSKTCLIVYTPANSAIIMRKISDEETRARNLRNDFIVYLAKEVLPVYSQRSIACSLNGRRNTLLIDIIH